MLKVKIIPNEKGSPAGKLADAELLFEMPDPALFNAALRPFLEVLAGNKLVGFAIWENLRGGRNVTFPARAYSINGERRSFSLLRPIQDATHQEDVREFILDAYKAWEEEQAVVRG